ncbi:hypothetical protein [Variovorax sp. GB1P17]|uniref:hypothetical protein n=1 Tax=Variovorax sp. GB1P17 TaxID=3443740 RepID=UPI003F44E7B6
MMTRPFGKPALSRLSGAAIAAALVCVGCASTGDNLQRETARAIGGNVTPEQVTVSNIDRGATSVKWQATAPGGRYACSADDMVRRVLCTKSR